jgi:hypothetical protein
MHRARNNCIMLCALSYVPHSRVLGVGPTLALLPAAARAPRLPRRHRCWPLALAGARRGVPSLRRHDAEVAELSELEIELGPVNYYRQGDQTFLITPALVLNFGLGKETEIVIDANLYEALGKSPRAA